MTSSSVIERWRGRRRERGGGYKYCVHSRPRMKNSLNSSPKLHFRVFLVSGPNLVLSGSDELLRVQEQDQQPMRAWGGKGGGAFHNLPSSRAWWQSGTTPARLYTMLPAQSSKIASLKEKRRGSVKAAEETVKSLENTNQSAALDS